jgi:prepilin-type N-terminal cleavage/methylation domain-containing protein
LQSLAQGGDVVRTPGSGHRGFTLLEVAVTVAIALIVAGLVVFRFDARPGRVASKGLELLGVVSGARLQALASGNEVSVMVFPQARRIVVYEDDGTDGEDFYDDASAVNFETYDPFVPRTANGSVVHDVVDFGTEVDIGPPTGWAPATMPAPFDGIDIRVDCGFCLGPNRRGAIVFDSLGAVRFQADNGPPLRRPKGASFTLTGDGVTPLRSVVVAAPFGVPRLFEPPP